MKWIEEDGVMESVACIFRISFGFVVTEYPSGADLVLLKDGSLLFETTLPELISLPMKSIPCDYSILLVNTNQYGS